jgi:dTDP-L-rhamnose 4-epimerase
MNSAETPMNILITGGAGFIGSNLALSLIARGHRVTVLDNLSPQIHGADSPLLRSIRDKVRFIHGDVRRREDWVTALEDQQAVVHLAAETGTGQSMYEVERYVDVNIRGTAILLDLLANQPHGVRKLVVASSRSIYGEGRYRCAEHGIVYPLARLALDMERGDFHVKCPHCATNAELLATTEDSRIHPSSLYGITKQNQEQMILTMGRSLGIPAVALRSQNVYGPGQSLSNPYTGILSIFSTRIKNGNEIVIFEDGEESRDFVFIDDVVRATVASVELKDPGQHVVNIGAGVRTSVMTVARSLIQAYGADVPVRVSGNFRLGDIRDNFADISAARALLGFEPQVDFATGISRFAAWVDGQAVMEDHYDQSIAEMKAKGLYK